MHSVRVELGTRSYEIRIGQGVIAQLGLWLKETQCAGDPFIITNRLVSRRARSRVERPLLDAGYHPHFHLIPDSEQSKSFLQARICLRDLARFDYRRKTFIIALGGGVVGDLAGFVASIYKRGIPYVQVPTTLLAQVDSAIGGKTAVDLPEGKNLIGAFYQPKLVVSDVSFISTLGLRQVRAGLAEVIKYAAIKDARLFEWLEGNLDKLLSLDNGALEYAVRACSAIKAELVSLDERDETGVRMLLNFGHTIGHAIEAAGKYRRYTHGEAVALGMLAAARMSERLSLTDEGTVSRLGALLRRAGLPASVRGVSPKGIFDAHYRDKKFIGGRNRFVLLRSIGRAQVTDDIPLDVIKQTVENLFI